VDCIAQTPERPKGLPEKWLSTQLRYTTVDVSTGEAQQEAYGPNMSVRQLSDVAEDKGRTGAEKWANSERF
jgi:hypothetical protein